MKWPWERRIDETGEQVDKRTDEEHEEIERRLSLLESQVKVLNARAGLEDHRRAHA